MTWGDAIRALPAVQPDARCDALTAERDEAINQLDSATHSVEVLEKRVAKFMANNARLRETLRGLERASTEVASCGARTGPQWIKLTVANLRARAALKGETP